MVVTQEMIADKVAPVKWHGGYFSMVCPFHDDREPSLLVYRDGGYCMGCRHTYSLNAIWFRVSKKRSSYQNMMGPEKGALNWMAAPEPEELAEEAHAILESYVAPVSYLRERGIERRLEPNRIGWWDGYFTFPGYNQSYEFQGLIARAGPEIQALTGIRYLTPPGQEPFLYVPDWRRIATLKTVYVTFGIVDALALADLGFASCTPTNGSSTNAALFEPIRKRIVIVPDKTETEIDVAYELASTLGWRGEVLLLEYPTGMKDPADMHAKESSSRASLFSQLESI